MQKVLLNVNGKKIKHLKGLVIHMYVHLAINEEEFKSKLFDKILLERNILFHDNP